MVSGREMWMTDSWLPGKNPGNSQSLNAVAWEAAEKGVMTV